MNRDAERFGDGDESTTARATIELGHDDARHAHYFAEDLRLLHGVLSCAAIEHQKYRVRQVCVELFQDAHDLVQLVHQVGLVLQAPGGIDQDHVAFLRARR